MDTAEALVQEHLLLRGFADVDHEPDGNHPPDFVADARVAVEVRRLNKHHPVSGKPLEREFFPLFARMERLLAAYGPPAEDSWWISYRFQRPLPQWRSLEPKIRHFLESVRASGEQSVERDVDDNFFIRARMSEVPGVQTFEIAVVSDLDSGGAVVAEVARNLQLCLDEKTRKVAQYRHLYPEWWLVLVDHIGYSMSEFSRRQFADGVRLQHEWDKIVLVRPGHPDQYFDLPPTERQSEQALQPDASRSVH